MSHPLDIVRVRPHRFAILAEGDQTIYWPQTFTTSRQRAGDLSVDILETVTPYDAPVSEPAPEPEVASTQSRKARRAHNRLQQQTFNRAG